ncbi:MAG: hypothetical protein RLZZ01_118 [Actinomycetota bacterium]
MGVRTVRDVSRHHTERMRGIEPPYSAWEADVLPLNYIRNAPEDSGDRAGPMNSSRSSAALSTVGRH